MTSSIGPSYGPQYVGAIGGSQESSKYREDFMKAIEAAITAVISNSRGNTSKVKEYFDLAEQDLQKQGKTKELELLRQFISHHFTGSQMFFTGQIDMLLNFIKFNPDFVQGYDDRLKSITLLFEIHQTRHESAFTSSTLINYVKDLQNTEFGKDKDLAPLIADFIKNLEIIGSKSIPLEERAQALSRAGGIDRTIVQIMIHKYLIK